MKIWKAHYKDEKHDIDVDIVNTEGDYKTYPLSMVINGTKFYATSPNEFELAEPDNYDFNSEEFKLLKYGGKTKTYILQGFSLSIDIPFPVVNKSRGNIEDSFLHIAFMYREPKNDSEYRPRFCCDDYVVSGDVEEVTDFSLHVCGEVYSYSNSFRHLYFEGYLREINKLIKDKYSMKCCYSCQYSDYSPYGGDDFGCMMCYRNHKSEYLKVNDKDTFFEYVEGLDCQIKQETFLCEEYEPRIHCAGYRGYID